MTVLADGASGGRYFLQTEPPGRDEWPCPAESHEPPALLPGDLTADCEPGSGPSPHGLGGHLRRGLSNLQNCEKQICG